MMVNPEDRPLCLIDKLLGNNRNIKDKNLIGIELGYFSRKTLIEDRRCRQSDALALTVDFVE